MEWEAEDINQGTWPMTKLQSKMISLCETPKQTKGLVSFQPPTNQHFGWVGGEMVLSISLELLRRDQHVPGLPCFNLIWKWDLTKGVF